MKLNLSPDTLALNPGVGRTVQVERAQKEAKKARIPRAENSERDGLSGLLTRGWSTETRHNGTEWRLREIWGKRRETQWHDDQSKACAEAKRIEKDER